MLPKVLTEWNVRHVAEGLALTPPDGGSGGGVRIRERLPLQSTRDVIGQASAQMAGFETLDVSDVESFTTYEGEYAAILTIVGSRGSVRFERTIGIVWGDLHCSRIDGGTDDPTRTSDFRQAVHALCYYHCLGLGELRRRRYLFTPPPQWQGYPRGLVGLWFPPDYPRNNQIIEVFPARPIGTVTRALALDRQLHEVSWFGFEADQTDEPISLVNDHGLTGASRRIVGRFHGGPRRFVDIAVLEDARFHYALRHDTATDDADDRSAFAAMVHSVTKLPAPVVEDTERLFSHWIV